MAGPRPRHRRRSDRDPLPPERCIATSIPPDTGRQYLDVFRRIRTEFTNQLAMNSWITRPRNTVDSDT